MTLALWIIAGWAFWCLLSRRVSDGIAGKVLYLLLILAALGAISHPGEQSQNALNWSVAALGLRHAWMKLAWPHVRAAVLHRVRCAMCPLEKGKR